MSSFNNIFQLISNTNKPLTESASGLVVPKEEDTEATPGFQLGFRFWNWDETERALMPMNSHFDKWTKGINTAVCNGGSLFSFGGTGRCAFPPEEDCHCGFNCWYRFDDAVEYGENADDDSKVFGLVAGAKKIHQHGNDGFRCAEAQILALYNNEEAAQEYEVPNFNNLYDLYNYGLTVGGDNITPEQKIYFERKTKEQYRLWKKLQYKLRKGVLFEELEEFSDMIPELTDIDFIADLDRDGDLHNIYNWSEAFNLVSKDNQAAVHITMESAPKTIITQKSVEETFNIHCASLVSKTNSFDEFKKELFAFKEEDHRICMIENTAVLQQYLTNSLTIVGCNIYIYEADKKGLMKLENWYNDKYGWRMSKVREILDTIFPPDKYDLLLEQINDWSHKSKK